MLLQLALVFIASFLFALALTPIVRQIAIQWGITDNPDNHRKLHGRVVARAGGTAVLGAVLLVCAPASLKFDLAELGSEHYTPYAALLTVMIGIWLLGLADDIWTLRGRQKLLGQLVLALILVFNGFQIPVLSVFGYPVELGYLAIPVSLVWLLATTNALNLIDGADGLCSTLGAVICGALGILASGNGHFGEAAIAFAMCGALLGFLVFNFPPASIFLGDSGSLLIGMVTGALAIRCSLEGATSVAMLGPLAILALPLMDSSMAILRRKLTGRSIYTTDRAHLHHSLKGRGLTDRGLLLVVSVLAAITAFGALVGQMFDQEWLALFAVLLVFGLLVMTKAFGHAEMVLVARRGSHFAMSFLEPARRTADITRHKAVRLQGTREWETVWTTLVEFAEREELSKLHLDLNVPWLEEGFHGTWQRSRLPDRLERWQTTLPIFGDGQIAGRIEVIGPAIEQHSLDSIARLVSLIEDLTPQVSRLLQSDPPDDSSGIPQSSEMRAASGERREAREEEVARS
ncbi:MAG: undecaprenyl/decaprenyl-phosphate alpha-N-acetylglucosaminyl 1-phosphate transferase [bacterium]|nr:undecaprenyl/decaprenyl-phosphate alpha-N-acetylglucosaminyl 1-phosphate transferase [bacterium]